MKQPIETEQPTEHKEPFQLFMRGEGGVFVGVNQWVCSTCMISFGGPDAKEIVTAHCNHVCSDCGRAIESRGHIKCGWCLQKADAKKRADRLAAATEVPDWDGPVYWDGEDQPAESTFGDDWWEDVKSFADCWEADANSITEDDDGNEVVVQPVEFVFCGKMKQLEISLEHAFERIDDEGYEDITEGLHGQKELFSAVDAFNKLNQKAMQVWRPDYARKVRVPRIGAADQC